MNSYRMFYAVKSWSILMSEIELLFSRAIDPDNVRVDRTSPRYTIPRTWGVYEIEGADRGYSGKPFRKGNQSYCQIWCMPRKSSGDLVGLFDLFSVNKCHAFNDLCQVFEAA